MKNLPTAFACFAALFASKAIFAQPRLPEIRPPRQVPNFEQATKTRSPLLPRWNLDAIDPSRYAIDRSQDIRTTVGIDAPPVLPEDYPYDRPREGYPIENPFFKGKTINRTAPRRLDMGTNFISPADEQKMPMEAVRPPLGIEAYFLNYHLGLTPDLFSDLPLIRFAERGNGEILDLLQVKNIFNMPLSYAAQRTGYTNYDSKYTKFFSNSGNFDKVNFINSEFGDPFRWNAQFKVSPEYWGLDKHAINKETFPQ